MTDRPIADRPIADRPIADKPIADKPIAEERIVEERSFEELYSELEETVRKLEAGDLPLAESLALFERSTWLAEQCNALLDRAELRVRQLTQAPNGELSTQPLEGWQG